MIRECEERPPGPYSLALTAAFATDATRTFRDGILTSVVRVDGRLERGTAWQRPDGAVVLRGPSDEAVEALRFQLALDDDHTEFLLRFRRDGLVGVATLRLAGLRQLRVPTVAHAILRALCGQLVDWRRASGIEAAVVRAATPAYPGLRLHAPPTASCLGALAPARLRALGLHARRGAALVRLCRALDPERLHGLPTEAAARRLERERSLGPWSVGVVCQQGLGRHERGIVGDLGLVKLLSALRGRRVEPQETAELLAPYEEWAGLAGLYLLTGWSRGLVPVPRT